MSKRKSEARVALNGTVMLLTLDEVQMMDEAEHCLNCGVRLRYLSKSYRGYCSLRCVQAKPPKMAYLEKVYGKPIKTILLDSLGSTDNVRISADLLGIGRNTLYRWVDKLGIRRIVKWV